MEGYKINNESTMEKKMRAVEFFSLYFKSFKYILLSNLMFFVPVLLTAAVEYGLYKIFGGTNIFILAFSAVILNPFFAGVTLVTRYICEKKEFSVTEAFFRGIKENWLKFLLYGIVTYSVFIVSYFSISLYYSGTKNNSLFWVPLVITAVIALFVLFSSYYANIMTVTVDIRVKDILRNCALFSFGELKNNVFVTLGLIIMAAVMYTLFILLYDPIVFLIVSIILIALILPATFQYIITFYVYDDMVAILDVSAKEKKKEKNESVPKKPVVNKEEAEEISRLIPEGNDEYVFHNGRMIKRSVLEEMYKDRE